MTWLKKIRFIRKMIWTRKVCTWLAWSKPHTSDLPKLEDLSENSPTDTWLQIHETQEPGPQKRAALQSWTPEYTAIKCSTSLVTMGMMCSEQSNQCSFSSKVLNLGHSWQCRGWDLALPLQGVQVRSLVMELRSHKLCGMATKNTTKTKQNKQKKQIKKTIEFTQFKF